MSILTTSEVKKILGIADTDSSKDNIIAELLPLAESFFFDETHNYCEVATEKIYLESNTISFASGSPSQIIDSANQFISSGFKDGMVIRVKGSYYNDGVYTIATVAEGELLLGNDYSLSEEDLGIEVRITIIKLPHEAKLFIAKLIEFYFLNDLSSKGIESERFDDYSVKYVIKENIPGPIMQLINPLRVLSWD